METNISQLAKTVSEMNKLSEQRHEEYHKNDSDHAKALNDVKILIEEYIKGDIEWKKNVTPSIEVMKSMQNFTSTGAYLLKTIILVGGAIGAVYGLWMFIKKSLS